MDGNGRWAKLRGKIRAKGHEEGAKKVRVITEAAITANVKYLTLYAFSTENWARPKPEVEFLMKLLGSYLESELPTYQKNQTKFIAIGDTSKFSDSLREKIKKAEEATKNNKKLTQILAINYGSKDEITRAAKRVAAASLEFTEENIAANLDTKEAPPVDMLIRTGGDKRLSNFLLWQSAYAELFFTDTLWPDFGEEEFFAMIEEFKHRDRRFGRV